MDRVFQMPHACLAQSQKASRKVRMMACGRHLRTNTEGYVSFL